jgi:thiamine-phosphate pyrophosphorylase
LCKAIPLGMAFVFMFNIANMILFKAILISQPDFFIGEKEILVSLFEADLQDFHLRKPNSSLEEMSSFIAAIPQQYHNRIIVHSHYELATKYNLKGIHCTGIGREEFYKFEDLPIQKSTSTHGFCEAGSVEAICSYAFLSPVFDSISKPGYQQGYQHDAIRQFLDRPHRTAFIALGGISPENIQLCKQMGFAGVALLGTVWESQNPVKQWKKILQIIQSL